MTITIQLPSGERREFKQDHLLIGRGAHCQICLSDIGRLQLQDEHARLRKISGRWMVESGGAWLIRAGDEPPSKFGWLKTGDAIRLSPNGPELIFEPAQEDVVLSGLETPSEAIPTQAVPPPLPGQRVDASAIPPVPNEKVSRTSPPPLPGAALTPPKSSPPPLPGAAFTPPKASPPPLPKTEPSSSSRSQPPPLPNTNRRKD